MTDGLPIGAVDTSPDAPPIDTGEADGLDASKLTITVGFGSSLFDDRFGFGKRRPAALADIPALPGDALIADISNGDLCVQACSDDPLVAFHVIRNFARLARGTAVMRWSQLGFGRTSSTSTSQATPRNLLGFKDGTRNIKAESAAEMDKFVWIGDETDQPWMKGGSYVVTRRIRMRIESWDTDYLADQEKVIGRFKTSGAPLTGTREFDTPQLGEKGRTGSRSSTSTRTSRWPRRSPTTARRSCAGVIRSPTASTRRPVCSTPACSSSPTSKTRAVSSYRFSAGSASTTCSTSTSGTPAAGCTRCRPA